jgi:hypothetical protein
MTTHTTTTRTRLVAVDERGYRVGSTHHNSTIPDAVVRAVRDAHENELRSYGWIARNMGLRKSTVAKICRYERRATIPTSWRRLAAGGHQ